MKTLLNERNYKKGFLVADQIMAGVSETPDKPGFFDVFTIHTETLEPLTFETVESLSRAIQLLQEMKADWQFEPTSGCSGGKCADGGCKSGDCALNDRVEKVSLESAVDKIQEGTTKAIATNCSEKGDCL